MQLVITFGLCAAYVVLLFLFPFFFDKKGERPSPKKFTLSFIIIAAATYAVYAIVTGMSDLWLSNRILHIFGGGFSALLVCFLAAKDSGVRITGFQFFFFSFLVVTTLGVCNEVVEFFLQSYFGLQFAGTVEDTWFDLTSNMIGAVLAGALLTPLLSDGKAKRKQDKR